jgi:hypothetical protein
MRAPRSLWRAATAGAVAISLLLGCGASLGSAATGSSNPYSVAASREKLTTNSRSPVIHDNEIMALATHDGRLFAATDQWEYQGPSAYGQVLVKNAANAPWRVFEKTQSLRVQALDSFRIPIDQGLGAGHSLLITQAIVDGKSRIQWLLDGATSFTQTNSFTLASTTAAVRSFGAHESNGVWSVYAGVGPTGVLRGSWSKSRHTLVFSPTPELMGAAPRSRGLKTQKVTAFANCGGALYVTINTKMFRRNDGTLASGMPRWTLVYQEPPVGAFNSGLRGLSCVTHDGSPVLLFSTEGSGDVYRLDDLPKGQLASAGSVGPVHPFPGLAATLEFAPITAIGRMLAADGTTVPSTGPTSIDYVIVAYNNFETMTIGGATRQFFGLEWGYAKACPSTRICAPSGFDASACFGVRTAQGQSPTYTLRCLSGPTFRPSTTQTSPVRNGQAFVSIRTIKASPFGANQIYYGGYDNDFHPADGTAWVASSTTHALHLGVLRSPVGQ